MSPEESDAVLVGRRVETPMGYGCIVRAAPIVRGGGLPSDILLDVELDHNYSKLFSTREVEII